MGFSGRSLCYVTTPKRDQCSIWLSQRSADRGMKLSGIEIDRIFEARLHTPLL